MIEVLLNGYTIYTCDYIQWRDLMLFDQEKKVYFDHNFHLMAPWGATFRVMTQ